MKLFNISAIALTLGFLSNAALGIQINVKDDKSVKDAASVITYGLMKYYTGNHTGDTPGNLPDPYYWWEAGAMFGTLIDYWALTGDTSYNDAIMQAMVHQASPKGDYMPENQTRTMGNDDQGFWALAAMSAAENVFPNPPKDKVQWLAATQAVFNEYVSRWNDQECGGGLRWQVFNFNVGWNYKNTISNGCFFNIAARLARYTGDKEYANWAGKIFDWVLKIGLITSKNEVLDGIDFDVKQQACTKIDSIQWSYNVGIYLHGSAAMYNLTNDDKWKARVDGFLKQVQGKFLKESVLYEQLCEPYKTCNNDQSSFKGYLARFLASTSRLAPHTATDIQKILSDSGTAAAAACSGPASAAFKGIDGTGCGFKWVPTGYDGTNGVGHQMNALSAVMYNLARNWKGPVTGNSGGNSKGDKTGGISEEDRLKARIKPITTADKAGAGILTAIILVMLGGFVFFLASDNF